MNPDVSSVLSTALARLEGRIDWEKRDRSQGWRVDLEPVRDLLERLGRPDRGRRTVHVTGSKGKGSVASLVAAGLRAAGWRTGTYGSPHVERLHERIRLGPREIEDAPLARAVTAALDAQDAATVAGTAAAEASWFDLVSAAALVAFREADVDWQVLEVGLGGRLDSTNAVRADVSVLTNVHLEHTAILGDTREAIAVEKAGIAKRGVPFVHGLDAADPAGDPATEAAERTARAAGASVIRADLPHGEGIEESNRTLAARVLATLGTGGQRSRDGAPLGPDLLSGAAIRDARLPGRLELRSLRGVPVLLDGAHVAASLARVLRDAGSVHGLEGPPVVVLSVHREKPLGDLLGALLKTGPGPVDSVLGTTVPSGLHLDAGALTAAARSQGLDATEVTDAADALDQAAARVLTADGAPTWILVTGSLYLVGALRGRLDPIADDGDARC